MTSSQASDPTLSTQEPNPSESQRNEKTIICKHCSSVVILPNVGVWNDLAVELPLARQQKGVNTQKESISGFWAIRDMMAFENVGFTNAVDGVSYLSCADCEYGPIGFVDNNTKLHLITPARLETKD